MGFEIIDKQEKRIGKQLYDYQQYAMDQIFGCLEKYPENYNLLYQLPTGGGKTVIFSEITKRYINDTQKKVLILTHRIELCMQTSNMLIDFGVSNKIINSKVKELSSQNDYTCFVAMVETLNNRLQDEMMEIDDIGLVIIDEAHYNSFSKLFKYFKNCVILGVTATPLSSNITLPMNENYDELIVGNSITSLIDKGFLSKATTYSYDVSLGSLKVGINGDYTVNSSEKLYSNYPMQEKLLHAYEDKCKGKKTLIFNNGINTSLYVCDTFKEAGYDIKHLDHNVTEQERKDILSWFKSKPDAILTSVSILTTGFDEPTVESIILNRATKSLTLYHQMIGRGSRVLPDKSEFTVIDLGNNALRFGLWNAPVDWHTIFRSPDFYFDNMISDTELERQFKYTMPEELKARFSNTAEIDFNIREEYEQAIKSGLKSREVIDRSIIQHTKMCVENSEDIFAARELVQLLHKDIESRVMHYSYCLSNATDNYVQWLQDEYKRLLNISVSREF